MALVKILYLFLGILFFNSAHGANYLVGRGIADITGLVGEGVLYGYANPGQDARGIHLRQFSRAFVVSDPETDYNVALVTVEVSMVTQALRTEVVERLVEEFGDLYSEENVMLAPTHSHSTPGGHNTYWMYQFPSGGFVNQTFDVYVDGIVKSIRLAHNDLRPGEIYVTSGDLVEASINRSPASYDNNPEEERDRYEYDTDKEMTVLRFSAEDGEELGMISFYAVHTTNMKNYNHLVSTDNKGYAALRFEEAMNPNDFPGRGSFVAAFAQTAEGDATGCTAGAKCEGTDEPCDYLTSTCPGAPNNPALCTGRGPANEQFEDTRIIGELQYEKAMELYFQAEDEIVSGPVDSRHTWVNMSDVTVNHDGEEATTCRPSMGFSFAAGATDGPGTFPFFQGDTEGDPVIEDIVDAVIPKSEHLVACQQPKPILLPSGEANENWPWQPEILPLQLMRVGQLFFIGGPGEFTTMAGRRLAESVRQALIANGLPESVRVIFVGIANSFSSYITTFEEYQIQRYEGASTTYGPHTLEAHQQIFSSLAVALATNTPVDPGMPPPDLRGRPGNGVGNIRTDLTLEDLEFGDTLEDVDESYNPGDTASVTFLSGNPRNDMKIDGTYLEVQQLNGEDWTVIATDAHWETKFHWASTCEGINVSLECAVLRRQQSNSTITWDIPLNQDTGTYRLVHYGAARVSDDDVLHYEGISSPFSISGAGHRYYFG